MAQQDGATSEELSVGPERRQSRRHKTLKAGEIVYRDGHSVDCTVLDLSEGGARLRLGEFTQCPAQFTLRIGSGPSYRCRLVWHGKHELGAKFLSATLPRLLLVDDDDYAIAIWEKELSKHFDVHCASGAGEGLAALATLGPFAVVLSDMRMPSMDGVRFLAEVAERAPKTVRMMVTGYADLDTAMAAINSGHVYRFLTKPCALNDLVQSIHEAAEHYYQRNPEQRAADAPAKD